MPETTVDELNIKYGVDSTGFVRGLKDAEQALRANQLAVMSRATEINKELLSIDKSDQANQSRIKTLRDEAAQLRISSQEIRNHISQLSLQRQKLDETSVGFKVFGNVVRETGGIVTSELLNFTGVAVALAGAILVVPAAIGVSIKAFDDLDRSLQVIRATSNATNSDIAKIKDTALEFSTKTEFSAKEIIGGFVELARAGYTVNEQIASMPQILALATASGTDLRTVVQTVTTSLHGFGLETKDTGRLVDVIAQTAKQASTSVGDMGLAFSEIAPLAKQMNIPLEDVATTLGILGKSGLKGSDASTALRTIFENITQSSSEAQKAMKALGVAVYDQQGQVRPLIQIFSDLREQLQKLTPVQQNTIEKMIAGRFGIAALLDVVNASPAAWNAMSDSIHNAGGSAEKMAEIIDSSTDVKLKELGNSVVALATTLGEVLDPAFKGVINILTSLVQALKDIGVPVVEQFAKAWDGLIKVFKNLGFQIPDIKTGIVEAVKNIAMSLDFFATSIQLVTNDVDTLIVSVQKLAKLDFKGAVQNAISGFRQAKDIRQDFDIRNVDRSVAAFGLENSPSDTPTLIPSSKITRTTPFKPPAILGGPGAAVDAFLHPQNFENVPGSFGTILSRPRGSTFDPFVTSPFGPRVAPKGGASTFHEGIDIAAPIGFEAKTALAGTVTKVARDPLSGNYVVILSDSDGAKVAQEFLHLSKITVKPGQEVIAGQQVGLTGNTGNVTGPHLHYEVKVNGTPVNPLAVAEGKYKPENIANTLDEEAKKKAAAQAEKDNKDLALSLKDITIAKNSDEQATKDQLAALGPYPDKIKEAIIQQVGFQKQIQDTTQAITDLTAKHYAGTDAENRRKEAIKALQVELQAEKNGLAQATNEVEKNSDAFQANQDKIHEYITGVQAQFDQLSFDKTFNALTESNTRAKTELDQLYADQKITAKDYYQSLIDLDNKTYDLQISHVEDQIKKTKELLDYEISRNVDLFVNPEAYQAQLEKEAGLSLQISQYENDIASASDKKLTNQKQLNQQQQVALNQTRDQIAGDIQNAIEQGITSAFTGQGIFGAIQQFAVALRNIIIQELANAVATGLKPLLDTLVTPFANSLNGITNNLSGKFSSGGGLFSGFLKTQGSGSAQSQLSGFGPFASATQYGAALANGTSGIGPFANPIQYANALANGGGGGAGGFLGSVSPFIAPSVIGGTLGYSVGKTQGPVLGGLSGAASGALTGLLAGGPIGALVGGGIGLLSGIFGGLFGGNDQKIAEEHAQSLATQQALSKSVFAGLDTSSLNLNDLKARAKLASTNAVGPEAEAVRTQNKDQIRQLIQQRQQEIKSFLQQVETSNEGLQKSLDEFGKDTAQTAIINRQYALNDLAKQTAASLKQYADSEAAKTKILQQETLQRQLIEKQATADYKTEAQTLSDLLTQRDTAANANVFTRALSSSQVKANALQGLDQQIAGALIDLQGFAKAGVIAPTDLAGINTLISASGKAAGNVTVQQTFNGIVDPNQLSDAAKRALNDVFQRFGLGTIVA